MQTNMKKNNEKQYLQIILITTVAIIKKQKEGRA